MCGLV